MWRRVVFRLPSRVPVCVGAMAGGTERSDGRGRVATCLALGWHLIRVSTPSPQAVRRNNRHRNLVLRDCLQNTGQIQ